MLSGDSGFFSSEDLWRLDQKNKRNIECCIKNQSCEVIWFSVEANLPSPAPMLSVLLIEKTTNCWITHEVEILSGMVIIFSCKTKPIVRSASFLISHYSRKIGLKMDCFVCNCIFVWDRVLSAWIFFHYNCVLIIFIVYNHLFTLFWSNRKKPFSRYIHNFWASFQKPLPSWSRLVIQHKLNFDKRIHVDRSAWEKGGSFNIIGNCYMQNEISKDLN